MPAFLEFLTAMLNPGIEERLEGTLKHQLDYVSLLLK
ncbi:hypothetical protein CJA_1536 [Cellvibrio japonicus Ueda107]|uniref:Uncharacterized protein n=1 Tax=Cellvibrio japonicus (strain Ueda107) TaxID=498211 RepID=B3PE28_CELJU|nr:hypothetical protein CJA_1536 [Cellvibrio japonicus Ueda107]